MNSFAQRQIALWNVSTTLGKCHWTIELAKGKPSVEVASGEELVKALTAIKAAVEAGELDSQIETASSSLKQAFRKWGLCVVTNTTP